jgi:UDP-N-acetylmuramyl pentapeptide phosphotransferase/UDP-N-acetylglucosamine-1-phosphate transferase
LGVVTLVILAIALLTGSFALSTVLTAIVRNQVVRTGFVARPTTDRYHQNIIPLGGGIAIFTTLLVIILAAITVEKFLVVPGHFAWLAESSKINPVDFLDR